MTDWLIYLWRVQIWISWVSVDVTVWVVCRGSGLSGVLPLRLSNYHSLLVITEDGATRHNFQTIWWPIYWAPVFAPQIFPTHCSIPVVLDGILRATRNQLGDVSPPVTQFIMCRHKSFLIFCAPPVSLKWHVTDERFKMSSWAYEYIGKKMTLMLLTCSIKKQSAWLMSLTERDEQNVQIGEAILQVILFNRTV